MYNHLKLLPFHHNLRGVFWDVSCRKNLIAKSAFLNTSQEKDYKLKITWNSGIYLKDTTHVIHTRDNRDHLARPGFWEISDGHPMAQALFWKVAHSETQVRLRIWTSRRLLAYALTYSVGHRTGQSMAKATTWGTRLSHATPSWDLTPDSEEANSIMIVNRTAARLLAALLALLGPGGQCDGLLRQPLQEPSRSVSIWGPAHGPLGGSIMQNS